MADVSVKMGVSGLSQFKSAMSDAQNSVKTLDSALKMNEQQLKSTGDKETYLQNKITAMTAQVEAQTKYVNNARNALKAMQTAGVDPMSAAYQKMQRSFYEGNTQLIQMTDTLNRLTSGEAEAAAGADTLAQKADKVGSSLGGISKKMSLEQVISGIGTITSAMEKAAGKAVDLGEKIWENVMSSAKWADDSATMALMYGVDLDTFLKVQKLVQNGMDTSVEAILKSQQKLNKNLGTGSDSFYQTLVGLGLAFENVGKFGENSFSLITDNAEEMLWLAGQKIMAMGDVYEQEAKAQELFGKSWRELVPLFDEYESLDAYKQALENVHTNTEQEVNDLAALNDKVGELQGNIETLANKGWAALAPSLTAAADALNGLLGNVLDYLDKPEGKAALESLGASVSGLFEDLGKIDPESVVTNFTNVFDNLVGGFKWISEHKGELKTALTVITGGWAAARLTGGALQILNLINGIRGLTAGDAAAAGQAAGSSWGGAFAAAVIKAAPWLVGLYTLLNPAESAGNELDMLWDPNTGEPTQAGKDAGITWNIKDDAAKGKTPKTEMADAAEALENASERIGKAADVLKSTKEEKEQDGGTILTYTGILPKPETAIKQGKSIDLNKAFEISTEMLLKMVFGNGKAASESSILGKPGQLIEEWNALMGENNRVEVKIEPIIDAEAAMKLQEEASKLTVQVGARIVPVSFGGGGGGGGGGKFGELMFHANGIREVPFDGYMAILHKGEEVVPAREVQSRSYNSNLYVEKMIMNSGQDAEGLAAKMAAANRRTMAGYGS